MCVHPVPSNSLVALDSPVGTTAQLPSTSVRYNSSTVQYPVAPSVHAPTSCSPVSSPRWPLPLLGAPQVSLHRQQEQH